MLDKHIIAHTSPKANGKNVVFWQDYRVTVLGEKLFRLEKSAEKIFRDEATLSVWFRDMPPQKFTADASTDSLTVKTASVTLIVKENREDCRVIVDGAEKPVDNSGNLMGTYRTLDGFDGDVCIWNSEKIQLCDGVCSKTGVAVYDDSKSETLAKTGEIKKEYANGTDEYIFAFGSDYRGAVKALYAICGGVPLVPRFALGNWWSRYREYTDEEYLTVLHRFKEREIPLSVATVDMDWHYSVHLDEQKQITKSGKNTDFYGGASGWTGYSWNKDLFPDYKEFLRQVKAEGLKITLNLHPADGVRWFEDMYKEMAKAVGTDASTGEKIAFDIFDPVFANAYFSVLHKPYEQEGVDFWWIDWQQGKTAGKLGIDPLWALNHYHYLDNAKNSSEPLILSRYAGVGSHRYPLGFSGDTTVSWATLCYLPYFTATASNVGYGWWSHDIGGHHMGTHDGELYLRHAQFGVFSPINRYHGAATPTITKEPWAYKNGTGALIEEQMKLRHKLIPFLYTCAYRANKNAEMLIEPLYYYHQNNVKAYEYGDEYYFGKSLIVAPVVTPEEKDGYARVKVWLPQGNYTDIFTGDYYAVTSAEGEEKTLLRTLESIPVLAKAGTILPLSEEKGNGAPNPETLTVKVFSGNGEFTLYEDGREEGKNGEFFTDFTARESVLQDGKKVQTLEISSRGESGVIPENRRLRVRFENIGKGKVTLKINGKEEKTPKIYADCVWVETPFTAGKTYEIAVEYVPEAPFEAWKKRATKILTESDGSNVLNGEANAAIARLESVQKTEMFFAQSKLPVCVIERLKETL
jgi:alpha-glucosidase (family GH31 glycosyl hydrolase)